MALRHGLEIVQLGASGLMVAAGVAMAVIAARSAAGERQSRLLGAVAILVYGLLNITSVLVHGDSAKLAIAATQMLLFMVWVPLSLRVSYAQRQRSWATDGGPTEGDLVRYRTFAVLGAIGTAGMGGVMWAMAEGSRVGPLLGVAGATSAVVSVLWMRGLRVANGAVK